MKTATETGWSLVALGTLLVLTSARDALLLFSYPPAVGADGYYYVLQIEALLNHGSLYFPTKAPLVFYALSLLSLLTGDIVIAIKLGSIVLNVLLCVGIYALVSAITGNRWFGVLGGAITALSAMHFYMIGEFIKNLGALTLLIWGGWSAVRASQSNQMRWVVLSVVLLVAAIFSHISIWAIVLSLSTMMLLSHWLLIKESFLYNRLGGLFVILLFAILPALIAAQKQVALPAWIAGEFFIEPRWPIRPSVVVGKLEAIALLLLAPATLFLIVRHGRTSSVGRFSPVVAAVALWSVLITLNPFLNHDVRQFGIVGRLDHLSYLQVAILAPSLLHGIRDDFRWTSLFTLPLMLVFVLASMAGPLPKGLQPAFLSQRTKMLQVLPLQKALPSNSLVIARHGDEFVVTHSLNLPAQQRFPLDRSRDVYWLLHRLKGQYVTSDMIVVMDEGVDSCLVLVKDEDVYQWLTVMDYDHRKGLLAENPHLADYLNKSNSTK